MSDTISVSWPGAPLSESGWRRRIEELAVKAESLIGHRCSLQDTADLALRLTGLMWPVLGAPETVAATCRASLMLGAPGCIASSSPGDQWAEVHSRLDEIWEQAQQHPAAGVVVVPQPVLSEVRADIAPPKARRPRRAKPVAVEPAPAEDLDELPAAWRNCAEQALGKDDLPMGGHSEPEPEPQQHPVEALELIELEPLPVVITPPEPAPVRSLRPLAERLAPRPAPAPAPAPEQERIPLPELPEHLIPLPEPKPEPAPAPREPSQPPPPGWLLTAEVSELVELSEVGVGRWRTGGRFGAEGEGWAKSGRSYYYSPESVELLMDGGIPGGLDQLVAEIQAP
jgi:hypothetical protein